MSLASAVADRLDCARVMSILYALGIAIAFAEQLGHVPEPGTRGRRARERSCPTLGLGAGLLGAVAMAISVPSTGLFTAGAAVSVGACALCPPRSDGDGAQQLNVFIGAALLVGFNPWVNDSVGTVCLLSITAHACFAYFASGIAKLVAAEQAVRTRRRRPVASAMVFVEAAFPLALLGPWWLTVAFLAWGVGFHFASAIRTGFNSYFWAFLATYPAIAYTWSLLHH